MRRPFGEVLRAWMVLLPATVRIGLRRARRLPSRRPRTDVGPVQVLTRHGVVSFALGTRQPVLIDGRPVGELTTRDDVGTSTAESVVTWTSGSDESSATTVLTVIADASFARGNHRAAVWACKEQPVLIEALARTGFRLEGAAPPPWGDTRSWALWARLRTDPPVD